MSRNLKVTYRDENGNLINVDIDPTQFIKGIDDETSCMRDIEEPFAGEFIVNTKKHSAPTLSLNESHEFRQLLGLEGLFPDYDELVDLLHSWKITVKGQRASSLILTRKVILKVYNNSLVPHVRLYMPKAYAESLDSSLHTDKHDSYYIKIYSLDELQTTLKKLYRKKEKQDGKI